MNFRKIALCLLLVVFLLPCSFALGSGQQRVFDEAQLFTADEIQGLEASIAQFQKDTGMDFVLHTSMKDHGNEDSDYEAAADDYYDHGGFGFGDEYDGLIYYLNMNYQIQTISTSGRMIDFLTDERVENVLDASYDRLRAADYAATAQITLDRVKDYVKAGIPEGQYRFDVITGQQLTPRHKALTINEILISALIALVVGFISTKAVTGNYQLKGSTYRYNYRDNMDVKLTAKEDTFLRSSSSRMAKAQSSGGGSGGGGSSSGNRSGGSSVRTSSSGRSHGGGSRRF